MDHSVPSEVCGRVSTAATGINHQILVVAPGQDWKQAFGVATNARRVAGGSILTTRLDSDDALAATFVSKLHASARTEHVTCFLHGIRYDCIEGRAARFVAPRNAFISFMTAGQRTVFDLADGDHTKAHQVSAVANILTLRPMWAEVVHGGNVFNRWHPYSMPTFGPWQQLLGGVSATHETRRVRRVAGWVWDWGRRLARGGLRRMKTRLSRAPH